MVTQGDRRGKGMHWELELADLPRKKAFLLSIEGDHADGLRDRTAIGTDLPIKPRIEVLQRAKDEVGLKSVHTARTGQFV